LVELSRSWPLFACGAGFCGYDPLTWVWIRCGKSAIFLFYQQCGANEKRGPRKKDIADQFEQIRGLFFHGGVFLRPYGF